MNRLVLLAAFLLQLLSAHAQQLYIKTFGSKNNPPIIFIHGGPRGNAVLFEATTAQKLANKGFYVIVYDRRGEGRSSYEHATLTYQEAFNDLNGIYQHYHLQRANLIGFSFGGLVATLYTAQYPEKVSALILNSGLFAQQATYDHILDSVTTIYNQQHDTAKLKKVQYVAALDKNSAAYRGEVYSLASENGFFKAPHITEDAKQLYQAYDANPLSKNDIRNDQAPLLFYKNEQRTNIDVRPLLIRLRQQHMPVYALYGKQDAIFSLSMINSLKTIIGGQHFRYLDNSSHYLFVDQQQAFLNSLANWLK
ncbi:alpha/beta hydrolase [Chitinophaga agrisoli]|uniref:Alpha/beta hydrolase n=1 Tax=Chitinophaga agrisoli TaxID=2607653 RepID=A0A5B2VM48_9BACT|nr:alpha/beta hydrolase [Chitinophaga agrisoli]KAA2239576.1 alpha/beta hydrolase [Chitinophaga agrisoli]